MNELEITSYSALKQWFFVQEAKRDKLAIQAWEKALEDPTIGKIYSFAVYNGYHESIRWNTIDTKA